VKAHCLLPLLLLDIPGEWRPCWIAWAERVTVRRLEADVERALLLRAGHHEAWQRCKFAPERAQQAIASSERQLCAPDVDIEATQQLAWRLPVDVAALFCAVRETLRVRLEAQRGRFVFDGELLGGLLDCALVAWTARDPGARRPDPVIERDGYRCAVPGCSSRHSLHDHHITFNVYAYATSEPVNVYDSSGLDPENAWWPSPDVIEKFRDASEISNAGARQGLCRLAAMSCHSEAEIMGEGTPADRSETCGLCQGFCDLGGAPDEEPPGEPVPPIPGPPGPPPNARTGPPVTLPMPVPVPQPIPVPVPQ
jgi:hypothetical protein